MEKSKNRKRRFASVILAALMSIALLPAGVFADDPAPTCPPHAFPLTSVALVPPTATVDGVKAHYHCERCGKNFAGENATVEMSDADLRIPAAGPMGKKFKLDGYTVQFKTDVVKKPPQFMANSNIDHVWIKAAKNNIKVSWDNAKNMDFVDGIVILRKTGKSKVYKEVGRLNFKTLNNVSVSKLKKSYTDKTAKKKNVPYTYVAVTFNV